MISNEQYINEKHKLKILSFSPYSAAWWMVFPEAVYLKELCQIAEIKQIKCNGAYNGWCTAMPSVGSIDIPDEEDRAKICSRCRFNKLELLEKHFNFDMDDIEMYLDELDYQKAKNLTSSLQKEEMINYRVEDLEIGKIAQYEVLLHSKKQIEDFDENEFNKYVMCFYNCLLTYYATVKLFKSYKPDRVLIYNTLYHANNICAHIARLNGVIVYNLHASLSSFDTFERLIVGKDHAYQYIADMKEHWHNFKDVNLTARDAWMISKHYEQVFFQTNVTNYSPALKNVFDFYNVFPSARGKKIVLATMSSEDEINAFISANAVEKDSVIFKSQLEWISWLINYFRDKDEYCLIIRPHPREFPNLREKKTSTNAQRMRDLFDDLAPNIFINWPTDNINLFLMFLEVDLVLNSYSTAGLDALLFGLPVVTHEDKLIDHPKDLFYSVSNLEEYELAINQGIKDGFSFERIYKLYKWLNLRYNLAEFDISESTRYLQKPRMKNELMIQKNYRNYFLYQDIAFLQENTKDASLMREMIFHGYNTKMDLLMQKVEKNTNDNSDRNIIIEEVRKIVAIFDEFAVDTKWQRNIKIFLGKER